MSSLRSKFESFKAESAWLQAVLHLSLSLIGASFFIPSRYISTYFLWIHALVGGSSKN
ncbi:hypothetical protein L798_08839 [Zootermopsis nevadensis]|uniref:Uncharacterized protein n=1 Tax=Zootermopsis nevadensis TaxID=136037 RepID=A0A067R2M7_ZOONE|nr:hypothetical protein L798_08839 [Zootermopsis nevadensis]